MLIANDSLNNPILASEAHISGKYVCPSCLEELILKKGKVKIAHFAHRRDSNCASYGEGETLEHLQGKMDLYEWIQSAGIPVSLEVFLPIINQRADILYTYSGVTIAIEYQCSPISIEDVCLRTKGYERLGIKVIWIAGSKLAIKNRLTALQRSLIGEDGNNTFYFMTYNTHNKLLRYYPVGLSVEYRLLKTPEELTGVYEKTSVTIIDEKSEFKIASPEDIERNLSKLQLMSYYRNRYYINFFQLLYEQRLNLSMLPEEIHHLLASEWLIKTVSFEWKLKVLLWMRDLPKNQVITKRLLKKQIKTFTNEQQIIFYNCPNISYTRYEKPFDEFVELLVQCSCLRVVKEGKWQVNSRHSLFKTNSPTSK